MCNIKQVTAVEFLKEVNPECVEDVKKMVKKTGAAGLVLFRNMNMTASAFGNSTIMAFGPKCTYKTVEQVQGGRLNDMPSQQQHTLMWVPAEEL